MTSACWLLIATLFGLVLAPAGGRDLVVVANGCNETVELNGAVSG